MGKEWDSLASIEEDAKSAGGFGADAPTNVNAYAAARVRYGKMTRNLMVPESEADKERLAEYDGNYAGRRSGLPDIGGSQIYAHEMQAWHYKWAKEAFRVLKPGGFLLAMSGTRTYHRLACAIEDAGFEVRDSILQMCAWSYGSGFPKSLDVSKAIDKAAGVERNQIGVKADFARDGADRKDKEHIEPHAHQGGHGYEDAWAAPVTTPVTPEAAKWQGFGTALKPAWEPVVVGRKPLIGTVAENVLKHGTGALNIDASRVGTPNGEPHYGQLYRTPNAIYGGGKGTNVGPALPASPLGRWPANLILAHAPGCELRGTKRLGVGEMKTGEGSPRSNIGVKLSAGNEDRSESIMNYGEETVDDYLCVDSCPVAELDRQSGTLRSGAFHQTGQSAQTIQPGGWQTGLRNEALWDASEGGASRFFYVAKASRVEREYGLEDFPVKTGGEATDRIDGTDGLASPRAGAGRGGGVRNIHPTVKPVDLMRYLVKLVTPPRGMVLDPFLGSGTTGIAARIEGFNFIGIEREAEYMEIARARIEGWKNPPMFAPDVAQDVENAEDFFG